jgi:hypothetical protein
LYDDYFQHPIAEPGDYQLDKRESTVKRCNVVAVVGRKELPILVMSKQENLYAGKWGEVNKQHTWDIITLPCRLSNVHGTYPAPTTFLDLSLPLARISTIPIILTYD